MSSAGASMAKTLGTANMQTKAMLNRLTSKDFFITINLQHIDSNTNKRNGYNVMLHPLAKSEWPLSLLCL
jgi:hypothetical protein